MNASPMILAGLTVSDAARLATYLHSRAIIDSADMRITQLTGGQSNPTYLIQSGDRRLVLRTKPQGVLLQSAHAVDREYRVLHALRESDVPVPSVYLYCDDLLVIGTPFYVMEYLEGRVFMDQSLPGVTREERSVIYQEMLRVIAALHGVDYRAVGLEDFRKPGSYFHRQISRWTRQYRDSRTEDIPAMNALMEWLPRHIPENEETTIVHGDCRLDNLVFHPTEPRVIGVLDWELSTLGHPLADFSYHCMSWHIPASLWRGIGGVDLEVLGIPSEADYVSQYCSAAGRAAWAYWDFYMAYNLFRMAAILQGIAKRALDGTAASKNAIETGRKAGPLAEIAWGFAERYDKSIASEDQA
jgi:aminoglycoside phosphotransferase (APT) family kinase protein